MPTYFAVQNPMFQPAMMNILGISQSNPCLITTTFDGIAPGAHNYQTGLIVRLVIPQYFGMDQLAQAGDVLYTITVVNPTQFTIPVDSTGFVGYAVPPIFPGGLDTPCQVSPIGEDNAMLTMAVQNVLPRP